MREIKFRAWLGNEIINDVVLYDGNNMVGGVWLNRAISAFTNTEDSNFVLMQYTGIKDKNGKDIYEGDIIEFDFSKWYSVEQRQKYYPIEEYPDFIYGTVEYLYGQFSIVTKKQTYSLNFTIGLDNIDPKKIIGNLYENPELLK